METICSLPQRCFTNSHFIKREIEIKSCVAFPRGEKKLGLKCPYLRRSYQTKKDVIDVLMEAFARTLMLAFAAMIFATIIGVLLGVLAAVKQNTWMDTSSVFASVIGISAPSFFYGDRFAYLFGVVLHVTQG